MNKQLIITIGRESGSGGLEIAQKLGARLGITVYDKNIFEGIGSKFEIDDTSRLEQYDEKPAFKLFRRKLNGHCSSPEQQVVEMQCEFIKDKADNGDSFIILGRCGIKAVLDYPCVLVRIFIEADKDFKIDHVMEAYFYTDRAVAIRRMLWEDNRRRTYHDQFCTGVKWGERGSYDLVVKSNKLGIDGTVDFLEQYVRMRLGE